MIRQFLVQDNQFTGKLPETLYDTSTMEKFKCSNNKLQGTISSKTNNLVNLTVLSINNNLFSGNIPEDFSTLESVQEIFFEYNDFIGALFDIMGNKLFLVKVSFSPPTLDVHLLKEVWSDYLFIPLVLSKKLVMINNLFTEAMSSKIGDFVSLNECRIGFVHFNAFFSYLYTKKFTTVKSSFYV